MSQTGSISDEELLGRMRAGDEDAARQLFARHADELRLRVRRKLPRSLRPKVAASDVVQEAFLAAFLHLPDFEDRGDGSFAHWLGTIVERKLVDEVRNHVGTAKRDVRRERRPQSGIVRLAGASLDPSASTVCRDEEERQHVSHAIRALPPAQSVVLALVHEERLTLDEVARRTGRSMAAVRKLYSRAVLRLSAELREADRGRSGPVGQRPTAAPDPVPGGEATSVLATKPER